MLDRITEYTQCLENPEDWAVATIVSIEGSSPSQVGTSMAVSADLRIIGSLGGGCIESTVAVVAQDAIATGASAIESFGPDGTLFEKTALGGVGLTCGGTIEVLIQPLSQLKEWDLAYKLSQGSVLRAAELTRRVIVPRDTSDAGSAGSDVGAAIKVTETRLPAPALYLSGVHDASVMLAAFAIEAGWRVAMADVRPAFATVERVPASVELYVGDPAAHLPIFLESLSSITPTGHVAEAGHSAIDAEHSPDQPWTATCVMSHHPDLDVPVLDSALKIRHEGANTIDFIGAMGSRRATEKRTRALMALGHTVNSVSTIHSPLGLDIQANSAAETAISMFAELISAKNRASETPPLSLTTGPLHRHRPRDVRISQELTM